jgi:hypothetical protein
MVNSPKVLFWLEFGGLAGGLGRGRGWGGSRVREGPACGRFRGGTAAGERRGGDWAAVAAGGLAPATLRCAPGNVWEGELQWVLVRRPRGVVGWETEWTRELRVNVHGGAAALGVGEVAA